MGTRKRVRQRRAKQTRINALIWGTAAAFVAIVVVYSLFATGLIGSEEPSSTPARLAPDVTLLTDTGEFRLSDQRDNALLLYFSFPG